MQASSKFHRSFQNDRFLRGFPQFSQKKLPKGSFRARLPPNSTEQASKTIVSCDASDNFHRTSFQNERFARCFRQFSQKKLPKGSFRARLPPNLTEQASKTRFSSKFHRTSFQNERFARCFRQFSQQKLPKGSFRARLPPNFTEKASKMIVSHNFHRTSFQNERFARCFRQFSQKKLPKWSFRARLPPNLTKQASKTRFSCEASSKFHRTMLPKRAFRTTLPTISTENLHFATVSRNRRTESYERVHPAKSKCASRYNGVPSKISKCTFRYSGVRKNVWIYRPWTDLLRAHKNVRFYYSFGRSTPRFYGEGCPTANEICVSLQFWAIDTTFLARGMIGSKWNLRFARVLGDRHHVFSERVDWEQMKFAFRYSFGRSTPRF